MTIRAATPQDARAIAEVHVASWRHSYKGIVPELALDNLDVAVSEAKWRRIIENLAPAAACFVCVDGDGRVEGFVNAGPAKDNDLNTDAEIYAIYLTGDAQGKGNGTALFECAVAHLRNAGFRSMCLWFLKDNAGARRFYEKLGGRFEGERPYAGQHFNLPSCGCKWDLTGPSDSDKNQAR